MMASVVAFGSSQSSWNNSSSYSSKFSKHRSCPPSPPQYRVVCRGGSQPSSPITTGFKSVLHEALDSSGIDTTYAAEARQNFISQIKGLSSIEREISICINRRVDLAKVAMYIAAEDFALMSQSSSPLPVDSLLGRLFDLTMEFCRNNSAIRGSPEALLDSLDKFLYVKKGFQRSNARNRLEPHPLYLHSVLTYQSGSAFMLALVYSEILKVLRFLTLLDFDCEIFFPRDRYGLPRGYCKQKSKESDHPHTMTVKILLEEILKNAKEAFWPFQNDLTGSFFLRALHAPHCTAGLNAVKESGSQLESSKAARCRHGHGIWTDLHFRDIRLAFSACERLILLESDPKELRDYSALLYRFGYYEPSLQYFKLYQDRKGSLIQKQASNEFSSLEEVAEENLMMRLNLISMEEDKPDNPVSVHSPICHI